MIVQQDGDNVTSDGSGLQNDKDGDRGFLGKAALGAGIGTALGVAALAIPGVGPLVAAGAIAAAAIPTAAVTGAAVGLAAGSLASVFSDRDVSGDDADYYQNHLGEGGVFVSVDASDGPIDASRAREILYRSGGHSSAQAKMTNQY